MVFFCEASVSICVGPPALSRRSLCRAPALSVSGSGTLSLSVLAPTLSVSGPGALCVAARRSLRQGPVLSVSGPGAVCVGARHSLCGARHSLRALCVGPRRSVCRATALRSLCQAGVLSAFVSGLSLSGRFPHRARTLSVRGHGALCVWARRSPAVRCDGPGALCRALALCVSGRRRSLSGTGTLCIAVSGPSSRSGGRSVSAQRSLLRCLRRAPCVVLCRAAIALCRAFGALWVGPCAPPADLRGTHPANSSDPRARA